MDDAPILSARDLGHAYGSIVALHGVEFDLPPGRIGLVGANGAGKTTLIKILLGILRPTTGSATVLGFDATKDMLDLVQIERLEQVIAGSGLQGLDSTLYGAESSYQHDADLGIQVLDLP